MARAVNLLKWKGLGDERRSERSGENLAVRKYSERKMDELSHVPLRDEHWMGSRQGQVQMPHW